MRGSKRSSEIQCFQEISDGEKTLDRQVPCKPRPCGRGQGAQYKRKLPYREATPFRALSFTRHEQIGWMPRLLCLPQVGARNLTAPSIERRQEGIGT
jgi:hypothetical protein